MSASDDLKALAESIAAENGCRLCEDDGMWLMRVPDGIQLTFRSGEPPMRMYGAVQLDQKILSVENLAEHPWHELARREIDNLTERLSSRAKFHPAIAVLACYEPCPQHDGGIISSVNWRTERFACTVEDEHPFPWRYLRWSRDGYVLKEKP